MYRPPHGEASTSTPGTFPRTPISTNNSAVQSAGQSWPQLSAIDEEAGKKKEAEIEAERLWWAEASERQVKDLESTFGNEFQKTCSRLRSDIEASQDRLEVLVETEKRQRHASLADLRREIDEQQLATKDLEKRLALSLQVLAEKHDGKTSTVGDVALNLGAIAKASERANQVEVELERQKAEVRRLDVALSDLRKEFSSNSDNDQQHTEALLVDIRRELEALQEGRRLAKNSSDDTQALHSVITQSMAELAHSIEDASAHATVTEQTLINRLQEMRRELEAQDKKWCAEIFNAMELSTNQLAKSIVNERELRTSEISLLKARLDHAPGQLEALRTIVDGIRNENSCGLSSLKKQTEELALRITQVQALASSPTLNSPTENAGPSADSAVHLQSIIIELRMELNAVKTALHMNKGGSLDGELETGGQALHARVDKLEAALLQTAQESDLQQISAELHRLLEQLTIRLENNEAEVQKGAREILPLAARIYAAESELQRVLRDSGPVAAKVESLHAMVTLLDRKIAALPVGSTTGVHSSQPSRPSTPQNPAIPNMGVDLKASLGNLIEKVNKTLMASEVSAAKLPGVHATTAGLPLTSETTAGLPLMLSAGVANKEAGPPGNILEALQAVNELRERNLALREENAELAEELLAQDRLKSPSGSVRGLQWTPSAQQSACATPVAGESSTAQVMAPVVLPVMRGTSLSGVVAKQETSTSPSTTIQGGYITGDSMGARPQVSEARVLGVMKGPTFKPTTSTSNPPAVTGSLLGAPEQGLGLPRSLSRGRAPVRATNLTGGVATVSNSNGMPGLLSRSFGIRPRESH